MPNGNRVGITAAFAGSIAVVLVLIAQDAESSRGAGSGVLLRWLDFHGFVSPARHAGVPALSEMGLSTWTDDLAIARLSFVGASLASISMLLALYAEARREQSLYLSIGFVSGGTAIVLFDYALGLVLMGLGTLVVALLRRVRPRLTFNSRRTP